MKKFIIFFLMVFLSLGNYQVRSESTKINVDDSERLHGKEALDVRNSTYLVSPMQDVDKAEGVDANLVARVLDSNTPSMHSGMWVEIIGPDGPGSYRVCSGNRVSLDAQTDTEDGTVLTYQWTLDGQYIPGANTQSYIFIASDTLLGVNTFGVQVTIDGCEKYEAFFELLVDETPHLELISYGNCAEGTTIMEALSYTTSNDIPFRWVWFKDGLDDENVEDTTFVNKYEVGESGTYYVKALYQRPECNTAVASIEVDIDLPLTFVEIQGNPNVCETPPMSASNNVVLSAWANGIAHEKTTIRWYVDGMLWSGHNDNYRFGTRLPARAYPYEFMVKVSNGNGCFVESAPFEVMVHENPVVNITATETVICGGGEITMTANLNDYNTEFITYQWYKNTRNEADLIDGATRIDYTTTLEESASFIVAVEQTHSGCLVYDTIQIKVEEPMVLDSIKIDYTEICEGGQIIMEAKTSGGVAGGETYTWYKNGQRIPDAITATLIETPATVDFELTTYIYSVAVAQTASGCQTGLVDSLSVEVTVKPNPTVAIEGDPIVCEAGDNNITLIAHVDPTGNEDAYTYTWYEDNRILEVESNDTIKMQRDYRDHAYNFHVVVSGQNGCSVASDVFYAYVNDAPIVNIFASESEICAGGEVTLTAALNNWNAEQLELQWYKDSTLMPGETSLTYTTTLYDTAKFYLTVEQRNSDCLGANMEITVNVVPIPVIDTVIISETQICEGGQVTLTAEISGGVTGNEVYTWRKNGFVINGATGSTFTESPMPAGNDETRYTYSVEVTQGAAGCASDKKSSLELTVYPNPRVMISGDHHICETEAVFLIANVNHDSQEVGPLSYKWFEHTQYRDNLANGLGDNQFFSEYFYASENPYEFTVEVNRGNGCVSVSEKFHLYVHKQPVVNITATETEICENGVITLKANLDDYNQKYMTTQWFTREFVKESVKTGYDEDGNYTYTDINKEVITDIPGATENEYTAYFTENTEIGVRVMQTISDCYDIDMIMINVYDRPVVDSISVLSGYTAICDGGQIRLKANYSGGVAGKAIYTWYKNDVKIEGADKATLIDSPLSVDGDLTLYKYEVKVTLAASGCESEFSDAVLITVKPSPTVHISANSSLEYCETGSVILTANVAPDGDYNYAWYRDNRLVGNDATYTSSDLARETSYKYHVVVTEHPGCDVVSEPVEVTVIGQPIVTVELDNPTICEGGVATFTAHVRGGINDVNGLGQYEYAWHNNLVPEVLGTNATYTIPNNLDVDVYSYYVTVKSKYGCETTAYAENLQIVKDPEVTIRVAQGYDNVVCDGGTTMLTADIQYGFGTPSYQWYKNGNILVGETHQTLLTDELYYNVTAAYTVHVKMSGVDCEGKSEQFNVTVSPRHEIEITGNGNVCVGGTVTLTATLIDELLDGETLTYQWYRVHGGANSAILNATSVQYTTSELQLGDSYEYYVVATSSISGCTFTSGTVPANVVADPTVVLTAPTSICEGGDLVLQAFVYGGVDGVDYTYTWTKRLGSDVTQIETNEPTLTLNSLDPTSPSNLYYFTVTINRTDNTGCDATSNQVSVGVTPSVIVNVTMDNETVCQGTPITFTANVKPVGVYNYEWYVNDVLRGYNQSLTISNLPAGTTNNIYVKAIPINADNICQATSAVVHPVVNANPVVTSVIAEETTLCVGGSTTIKIATIDGQPFTNENDYTYQWSRNGIEIGGTLNSSIEQEFTTAGTYKFNVRIASTDGLGCSSEWSASAATVVVAPQPQVAINVANIENLMDICVGGEVEFDATVVNANPIYGNVTYTWYASGLPRSTTAAKYTETLNSVGTYSFYVVASFDGPISCNNAVSNTITVNVNAKPSWKTIQVVTSNPDGSICAGERIDLIAEIQGGVQDATGNTNGIVQWYRQAEGGQPELVTGGVGAVSFDYPLAAGNYDYFVRYSNQLGANSGCDLADGVVKPNSNGHTVTVHELPTAHFSAGEGSIICANDINGVAALEITFTGTAPFSFMLQNITTGQQTAYANIYQNPYVVYVQPTVTSTYRILDLNDAYCTAASDAVNGVDAVTVSVSNVSVPSAFVVDCESIVSADGSVVQVVLPITILSGFPTTYSVAIEGYPSLGATNQQIIHNVQGYFVEFDAPGTPGNYHVTIEIDGCDYYVDLKVPVLNNNINGTTVVDVRWGDVVVVNNNPELGQTYLTFQWYKNGEPIPGANGAYYQEVGGLNGFYSVDLTYIDAVTGRVTEITTCAVSFVNGNTMKVYPVPAAVNQVVTVETGLTDEELEGAVLDIFDAKGAHIQRISQVYAITRIDGFKAQGSYFGRIVTSDGQIKTVKFVVAK